MVQSSANTTAVVAIYNGGLRPYISAIRPYPSTVQRAANDTMNPSRPIRLATCFEMSSAKHLPSRAPSRVKLPSFAYCDRHITKRYISRLGMIGIEVPARTSPVYKNNRYTFAGLTISSSFTARVSGFGKSGAFSERISVGHCRLSGSEVVTRTIAVPGLAV